MRSVGAVAAVCMEASNDLRSIATFRLDPAHDRRRAELARLIIACDWQRTPPPLVDLDLARAIRTEVYASVTDLDSRLTAAGIDTPDRRRRFLDALYELLETGTNWHAGLLSPDVLEVAARILLRLANRLEATVALSREAV